MVLWKKFVLILVTNVNLVVLLNLDYLDPVILQTKTSPQVQKDAADDIIKKYSNQVAVEVNPILFIDNKDKFTLKTSNRVLYIRASSGVAAVWGFNYYLKKYCKSHIGWQVQNVNIPSPLPEVDEEVVANDRFRYYQNVCTASYSFAWWDTEKWLNHVEWMALNGINLALAPIAQEAAWAQVYRNLGMTDDEIDEHFTGPAFLAWLRMGNLRGWGGPLPKSWHNRQRDIQDKVVDFMYRLGIIPVLPAFNGHVPKAFSRIYPNITYYSVDSWNRFSSDYCCDLFLDPNNPMFVDLGKMYMREITKSIATNHLYTADPFNEVIIRPWSNELVQQTSKAIFSTLNQMDNKAVWLIQNWMFVHDPILWPINRVKQFLTSVPSGRLLVLDLQSEQWPQYDLYEMYFGQPFIWCMLHNFGGTMGMFGNTRSISRTVYEVRKRNFTTMIGIGLTPEGINQNYVVYDMMLESAWRKAPIADLNVWTAEYAERRYGCNATSAAWRYLIKSVYSFDGLNRIRGKYVITRRPSFKIKPWAWYTSHDLFEAFKRFVYVSDSNCNMDGFKHDLVDVTRQALQYRAEQLYMNIVDTRLSNTWVFNASIHQFLDVMQDLAKILASDRDFMASDWLDKAKSIASSEQETSFYEMNARNQITLWGPNGEISDYACKQWAELFSYYYIPRWGMFLSAALEAKVRNESFDEASTQKTIRKIVEEPFLSASINSLPSDDPIILASSLYVKWAFVPDLHDLPIEINKDDSGKTTLMDISVEEKTESIPTVLLMTTNDNNN